MISLSARATLLAHADLGSEHDWEERFEVPTLIAALLVIPTLVLQETGVGGAWGGLADGLNWLIWTVFTAHVATMLVVSRDRGRWLRGHVLDLLLVVLTPPFLPVSLQSARILRLLRLLRLAAVARELRRMLSINGLRLATLFGVFGVLVSGSLFTELESQQHLSTWDGIWWAVNTVTTTGSEFYPHTTAGRLLAMALVMIGVGYVTVLMGAVAQTVMKALHAEKAVSKEERADLATLIVEVAALRDEIRQLRSASVTPGPPPA